MLVEVSVEVWSPLDSFISCIVGLQVPELSMRPQLHRDTITT